MKTTYLYLARCCSKVSGPRLVEVIVGVSKVVEQRGELHVDILAVLGVSSGECYVLSCYGWRLSPSTYDVTKLVEL